MDDTLHFTIELALMLLLVIFAVAVVVGRIRLPYTIALLLAGLFGIQRGFHAGHLTPDLILLLGGAYPVRAPSLGGRSPYWSACRSRRADHCG